MFHVEDQQGRHILVASWVHGIHVWGDPGVILGADSLHGTLHPERILDVWPWRQQGDHILAASWPRGSGEKTKKKWPGKKGKSLGCRRGRWMQLARNLVFADAHPTVRMQNGLHPSPAYHAYKQYTMVYTNGMVYTVCVSPITWLNSRYSRLHSVTTFHI